MNRLFTTFVSQACDEIGASCEILCEGRVLRMARDNDTHLTLDYGFDINNAIADRAGNDKVAQYGLLSHHGLPAIKHHIARMLHEDAIPPDRLAICDPTERYVTKPFDSTNGDSLHLHNTLEDAIQYINSLANTEQSWSVSPYEELVCERRYVILDDELLLYYEKSTPHVTPDGLTLFNLAQGAHAVDFTPPESDIKLARQVARACTLRLCAIDIVYTANGEAKVMEINSGIMCESYARQSEAHYEEIRQVYRRIVEQVFDASRKH